MSLNGKLHFPLAHERNTEMPELHFSDLKHHQFVINQSYDPPETHVCVLVTY